MKILNFGSINIDCVYRVDHFVRPGETISSKGFSRFPGGKGFNQSTALARAGAEVIHAGCIGEDGLWLREVLRNEGVDVHLIRVSGTPTGHAAIQVDDSGQNCIIVDGGANREIEEGDAAAAVAGFSRGDVLLVQNEISSIPAIMQAAARKGMEIVFNPSPIDDGVFKCPLDLVSLFVVNEIEAKALAGIATDDGVANVLDAMRAKYPSADVVLTLGAKGAVARFGTRPDVFVPARKVEAIDTTAAGDTFTGYFLAERQSGAPVRVALEIATAAAAICVTRPGAAPSIPGRAELVI